LLFLILLVDALSILVEYHERRLRRKYRHSLDLVKEGLNATAVAGHVDYENDVIIWSYGKWAESSPMFSCIAQHLKGTYKKTWQAYENAKKYDENIVDKIIKKIQEYRQALEQKFSEAKLSIPASEEFIDYQTRHYNQKFVKHLIFKDIKHLLENKKTYLTLKIYLSSDPNFSSLNWGATTFAIADEQSLERLQKLIEQLENDETIISIIKTINSLEIQLKNNNELKRFNDEREEIVRQVIYGQKILRGTCNLCP